MRMETMKEIVKILEIEKHNTGNEKKITRGHNSRFEMAE